LKRYCLNRAVILVGALLAATVAAPLTGSAANVLHLRQVRIMDPSGFEQPVVAAAMLASYRPNPQWVNAIITVWANIQSGWSKTSGEMARIWAEADAQIDQTIMNAWQYRRDTVDRVSLAYSHAMRGVEVYRDPFTQEPTELPTGYRGGVWASNRGQYLLTDDPSFDPNVALPSVTWQRMKRMR
jgi:hypothetical protein